MEESLIGKSSANTRLCPSCANTVEADATDCPYCKADFSSQLAPQWLKRDDSTSARLGLVSNKSFLTFAKLIWPAAMLFLALIAFFAGAYMQGSELSMSSETHLRDLQAKEQMIQSQETQLAQMRQQLSESSDRLAEMKAKLEESEKALALSKQRLDVAVREADRLNASRSQAVRRTASRAPATARSLPQPSERASAPQVYETIRATSLYETASPASRVISQISGGTRINVVSSAGGWLEVRSKRGNPPGYVRSDDARLIDGAN
jgi:hypothetical protein